MASRANSRNDPLTLPGHSRIDDKDKHVEYLHMLQVPTAAKMEEIAEKQAKNEESNRAAARVIQRNYRGHRSRRAMKGMGLDASMRWIEAIKEAQYRHITQPMPKRPRNNDNVDLCTGDHIAHTRSSSGESEAREAWKRVASIARRAGGDNEDSPDEEDEGLTEEQRAARRQKKLEEKLELKKHAKVLDLQYFLEMVDRESTDSIAVRPKLTFQEVKHRYGSNLRAYHEEWKNADTKENFFYWLDYGEGKQINLSSCPRERLEREQVRYLSREERMDYLVKIDDDGRLCWAKNGARIDTSEKYKDSIHGIVPTSDTTPAFLAHEATTSGHAQASSTLSSLSFSSSSTSPPSSSFMDRITRNEGGYYINEELSQAKGLKKVRHVSAATILDSLLRKTVKQNTWIFVADTSFRLYVGIKQSGAFQHSSFLNGGRIAAAGLIKIKNGQIRSLSPLSGHYRPPASNFRSFVHMLKNSGADMSRVSISKSYAVLIGLEMYTRTRRKVKSVYRSTRKRKEEVLHPKAMAKEKERERKKSQSAEKVQEKQKEKAFQYDETLRDENATPLKVLQELHVHPQTPQHGIPHAEVPTKDNGTAGRGTAPPSSSSDPARYRVPVVDQSP